MAVTIHKKDQFLLTSPPAPIPTPDKALFVTHKTMCDGREIWISAPQPDRLSIIIPISKYVYADSISKSVSEPDFFTLVVKRITDPPFPTEPIGKSKYVNDGKDWRATTLDFGKRESRIRFSYLKRKDIGLALRLDMNPRKVGKQGFKELINLLGAVFSIKKLREAARVTRVDFAIDVVGIRVDEVLAIYKRQGTRSLYVGSDGALETIYIHHKRPPFKQKYDEFDTPIKATHPKQPAGKVILRIYDRRRERMAIGRPPPFADAPITRIELVKSHFIKFHLFKLPDLADPFGQVSVGYAPSQHTELKALWHKYWQLARSLTPNEASRMLGLSKAVEKQFGKAMKVPVPDLLAHKANWADWKAAIAYCGLDLLIGGGQETDTA